MKRKNYLLKDHGSVPEGFDIDAYETWWTELCNVNGFLHVMVEHAINEHGIFPEDEPELRAAIQLRSRLYHQGQVMGYWREDHVFGKLIHTIRYPVRANNAP